MYSSFPIGTLMSWGIRPIPGSPAPLSDLDGRGDNMSIALMSRIWDSEVIHDSSTLLVMLAIACLSTDIRGNVVVWTSVASIASKCRISKRRTKRIIESLERVGAIEVALGLGRYPANTHLFKVTI